MGMAQTTTTHLNLAGAVGLVGGLRLFRPSAEERIQRQYLALHPERAHPPAAIERDGTRPTDSAQVYREWLRKTEPGRASPKARVHLWNEYLERYPETIYRARIEKEIREAEKASIVTDIRNSWPPPERASVVLAPKPFQLGCPDQGKYLASKKATVGLHVVWIRSSETSSCVVNIPHDRNRYGEHVMYLELGEPGFWYCNYEGRDGCHLRDTTVLSNVESSEAVALDSDLDRRFLQGQRLAKGSMQAYGFSWGVVLAGIPALGIDFDRTLILYRRRGVRALYRALLRAFALTWRTHFLISDILYTC